MAWRCAGSTGNRGASKVQASATYLLLDEKRCHAPLLLQFERRTGGEVNLGLVDGIVRDEPLVVEDIKGERLPRPLPPVLRACAAAQASQKNQNAGR